MEYVTRRRKVEALLYDGNNEEEVIKFGRGFIQADHEGLWMGVMAVHQGWYLVRDDVLGFTLNDKETFNKLYAVPRKIARDSKTGRFTTKQYAQDNPDTTQEKIL